MPDDPLELGRQGATAARDFQATGAPESLDRSIDLFRRAVLAQPGTQNNAHLASVLLTRYEARGIEADLRDAEWALGELARRVPITSGQGGMLARLALYRYDIDADPATLDRAVRICRQMLDGTAPDEPGRETLWHLLGTGLARRFDRTGDVADLDAALDASRSAMAGTTEVGHRINFVRQGIRRLALRKANPPDPGEVIRTALSAADAFAEEHPQHGEMLHSAGTALRHRYDLSGAADDLDRSIRLLKISVERCGEDDVRAERRNSLGNALLRRFESTGLPEVLDEAIENHRRGIPDGSRHAPERAVRLNNLAASLRQRGLHFDDVAALREAIALLRDAIETAEDDARLVALGTLGITLQDLWEQTREPAAAEEAVAAARTVRAGSSVEDDGAHEVLANALVNRALSRADPDDLAESVRLLERVSAVRPFGHPGHGRCLRNLGGAWSASFELTGDPAALDRAITFIGRAVRADPVPEPERADYRRALGGLLLMQHERTGDHGTLRAAADAFAAVALDAAVGARHRVAAATRWSEAEAELGRWPEARRAAELAMELLPRTSSLRLARDDRERGLSRSNGVAAHAAACAARTGDPALAVRWLEQGRGVLLGQALEARGDHTELRDRHPALAATLAGLTERLDTLETMGTSSAERHAVAQRRDETLAQIRALPGFGQFLSAPTLSTVQGWAGPGPVVLINVSRHGCGAFVLRDTELITVPLPALTEQDAVRQADRWADALAMAAVPDSEQASGPVLAEVLAWLWDVVAEPVLDRIGFGPTDTPPRLWWSPGGPLASLPLHAAGPVSGGGVLDRVVSSYTPTVRALGYARTLAAQPVEPGRLLVVAVADAAGAPPLPYARREAAALAALCRTEERTTREGVLGALADHAYVHFACHGYLDPANPAGSRLLVGGAGSLSVLEVSRLQLPAARLAVLSACHTARNTPALADEAVHVAGAFQIAGYPCVVGTSWQVNDRMASRIAIAFHAALWADGPAPDPRRSAYALHQVLRGLRDYPPAVWAAWVHSGA